jgi:signal transduction histidine kinase
MLKDTVVSWLETTPVAKVRRSFYAKLSLILLAILLYLGAVQVTLFADFAERYRNALDQVVIENLAAVFAQKFEPQRQEETEAPALVKDCPGVLLADPRIEFYIVDDNGRVLKSFQKEPITQRQQVSTKQIEKFISRTSPFPIYGNTPREAKRLEVFSAAPIRYQGKPAYVYAILGGESFSNARARIRKHFAWQNLAFFAFIGSLVSAAVGLLAFFFLTKPLNRVASIVEQFSRGNLGERIPVVSDDEAGRVAAAFNQMADTISSNIEHLQKTDHLRRELVSNIAHDLRGPLTCMSGYAQTLVERSDHLPKETRKKIESTMLRNVEALAKLVTDLFDLSKLEAKDRTPKLKPVSLADFLPDLVCKFEGLAESANVTLQAKLEYNLPLVIVDISLIERALSNLVENAIANSPPGQSVSLVAKRCDDLVRVQVEDTGIGITEEDLPRVFERFYRGCRGEMKKGDGSGLGLAIVKKIMEAHGLAITVESKAGRGTTFSFDLPAASEERCARCKKESNI